MSRYKIVHFTEKEYEMVCRPLDQEDSHISTLLREKGFAQVYVAQHQMDGESNPGCLMFVPAEDYNRLRNYRDNLNQREPGQVFEDTEHMESQGMAFLSKAFYQFLIKNHGFGIAAIKTLTGQKPSRISKLEDEGFVVLGLRPQHSESLRRACHSAQQYRQLVTPTWQETGNDTIVQHTRFAGVSVKEFKARYLIADGYEVTPAQKKPGFVVKSMTGDDKDNLRDNIVNNPWPNISVSDWATPSLLLKEKLAATNWQQHTQVLIKWVIDQIKSHAKSGDGFTIGRWLCCFSGGKKIIFDGDNHAVRLPHTAAKFINTFSHSPAVTQTALCHAFNDFLNKSKKTGMFGKRSEGTRVLYRTIGDASQYLSELKHR